MMVTFAFFVVVLLEELCSLTNHVGPVLSYQNPFLNRSGLYKIGHYEAKRLIAAPS